MIDRIIKYLIGSEDFSAHYSKGVDSIRRSGILEALRTIARVQAIDPKSINYPSQAIDAAAFSRGYNQALDDLLLFREKFLDPKIEPKQLTADFGGFENAIKKGLLTETEANGLRGNTTD